MNPLRLVGNFYIRGVVLPSLALSLVILLVGFWARGDLEWSSAGGGALMVIVLAFVMVSLCVARRSWRNRLAALAQTNSPTLATRVEQTPLRPLTTEEQYLRDHVAEIAARLEERRINRGKSFVDMSRGVGFNPTLIAQHCYGHRVLNRAEINVYASYFRIPPEEIIRGE